MGEYFISADLAQISDFTAITIIESFLTDEKGAEYHLRRIERPERGTPYPKIVDRLKEIAESPQIKQQHKTVAIDITGVGRPVWDLLKQNFRGTWANLRGVLITGGNEVTEDGKIYRVPKRDLISALQVAFQNEQLKIARDLEGADTLVKELTNFKVKINLNGHDQYEAWREGVHDDIVLSAAMGVWLATRRYNSRNWLKSLIT
ncbi:MAG: hypothetical protein FWE91_08410 [Defluviitaleaceae bacterium]|nr:hypothetical protein [Defluviitaleaceae bacterium]MCL2835290.1 hypothetical protein [Defluviitaleaceae bacterium]